MIATLTAGDLTAQPLLSRGSIPRDAPAMVRAQLELLYGAADKRVEALIGLRRARPAAHAALPFLIGLLGDESPVRWTQFDTNPQPGDFYLQSERGREVTRLWRITWVGEEAAHTIAGLGDTATTALAGALDGQGVRDKRAAGDAAIALWQIGSRRALGELARRVQHPDTIVRAAALRARLRMVEPVASDEWVAALTDRNVFVRHAAFVAFARGLAPDAVSDGLAAQLKKGDRDTRLNAAEALAWLGDARALDVVEQELRTKDEYNERAMRALIAAGRIKDQRSIRALAPLLRLRRFRDDAADALVAMNTEAREAVASALKDVSVADREAQCAFVEALALANDSRALDVALAIVETNYNCWTSGIRALANGGDPRAVELLAKRALAQTASGYFAWNPAAASLGDLKGPTAIDALRAAAERPLAPERVRDPGGLDSIGYRFPTRPFVDSGHVVRAGVLGALWRLGDPSVARLLLSATLQYSARRERAAAQEPEVLTSMPAVNEPAFAMTADARARFLSRQWNPIAKLHHAVEVLGHRPEDSNPVSRLALLLAQGERAPESVTRWVRLNRVHSGEDPFDSEGRGTVGSWENRAIAARFLGWLRLPGSRDPLVAALRDYSPAVRQAAARALGDLGDSTAANALIPLLGDPVPQVRYETAEALGRIGNANAADALLAALEARDPELRWFSATALAQLTARRCGERLLTPRCWATP